MQKVWNFLKVFRDFKQVLEILEIAWEVSGNVTIKNKYPEIFKALRQRLEFSAISAIIRMKNKLLEISITIEKKLILH